MLWTRLNEKTTLILPTTEYDCASYDSIGCDNAFLGDGDDLLPCIEVELMLAYGVEFKYIPVPKTITSSLRPVLGKGISTPQHDIEG